MSIHTRIQTWVVGSLLSVALGGSTLLADDAARGEAAAPATTRAAFAWPGVYDLVGNGFPEGERKAVIHIARSDTSYALVSLQGPPGTLVRFDVTGDSARVIWNVGAGEIMVVDLRGAGDSLTGKWESGDWAGQIRGIRRR